MKSKWIYGAAAVLAVVSTLAWAKPFNEVEYVYLNAKGQIVGGKTLNCSGMTSHWGTVTGKYVTYSSPCD